MAELGKKLALGLGVTTVFFVLIELILMAVGVVPLYERTDPYVGFSDYAPLFLKRTPSIGEPIYETAHNKIKWFNMQRFPARKAAGTTRIFCVGGSTTYGRPYDDRTSFCGWLRRFLPAVDPRRVTTSASCWKSSARSGKPKLPTWPPSSWTRSMSTRTTTWA